MPKPKNKPQTSFEKALEKQAEFKVNDGMMMFGFNPEPPKKKTLVKLPTEELIKRLKETEGNA